MLIPMLLMIMCFSGDSLSDPAIVLESSYPAFPVMGIDRSKTLSSDGNSDGDDDDNTKPSEPTSSNFTLALPHQCQK